MNIGTGIDPPKSFYSQQDHGAVHIMQSQGLDESPRQNKTRFSQKLQSHRKNQELLNMAAQVETKNLMKFERQFVNLVSKKRGRNGRYNQSIDFVGSNMDLKKFANEAR